MDFQVGDKVKFGKYFATTFGDEQYSNLCNNIYEIIHVHEDRYGDPFVAINIIFEHEKLLYANLGGIKDPFSNWAGEFFELCNPVEIAEMRIERENLDGKP